MRQVIAWHFRELSQGEPERDPRESEFFRLTSPAEAVAREFIQNALDAKKDDKVIVRFTLGHTDRKNIELFFNGLDKHLECCIDKKTYNEYHKGPVSFLTVEDFGTTGLDGDTGDNNNRPQGRHNFYNFWWCEGISKKKEREAGRWGLGKTTFHIVSRIRSFWGLTLRHDDGRELLMGKSLLKTHRINGKTFHYDGYFTRDNYRPIDDKEIIKKFKESFALSRKTEYGFSLVVPFLDGEINFTSIEQAVIIHWSYAIMKGMLEVGIKENNEEIYLDHNTIMNEAYSQNWEETSWKGVNVNEFLQFLREAVDISKFNNKVHELDTQNYNEPEISEASFGEKLSELRDSFNSGSIVAFRIFTNIEPIDGSSYRTYFDIYLKRSQQLKESKEVYIRSGIMIPGIRTIKSRPVYSLFSADDVSIASFLGDSETPSHSEWNERTEGFKDKYKHAVKTLRFIKNSVSRIVSILDQTPTSVQKDFLEDVFYIPLTQDEQEESEKIKTKPPKIYDVRSSSPLFEVKEIRGGFKLSLSKDGIKKIPIKAKISIAYDVRRGNPFKQYDVHDFDLGSNTMNVSYSGCRITHKERNEIRLEVINESFYLEVRGFDVNRDLVLSVVEIQK
ncbi:MAG: hypothetical protein ACP5KW_08590 [Thermoproteota archaeon]|jgi:hypothetical protein